jgi:hypothetical protein
MNMDNRYRVIEDIVIVCAIILSYALLCVYLPPAKPVKRAADKEEWRWGLPIQQYEIVVPLTEHPIIRRPQHPERWTFMPALRRHIERCPLCHHTWRLGEGYFCDDGWALVEEYMNRFWFEGDGA